MLAHIRKAIIAGLGALVTGEVAAIVQAGGMPGLVDQLPVVLGALAVGYAAWRTPNAAPAAPGRVGGGQPTA